MDPRSNHPGLDDLRSRDRSPLPLARGPPFHPAGRDGRAERHRPAWRRLAPSAGPPHGQCEHWEHSRWRGGPPATPY